MQTTESSSMTLNSNLFAGAGDKGKRRRRERRTSKGNQKYNVKNEHKVGD